MEKWRKTLLVKEIKHNWNDNRIKKNWVSILFQVLYFNILCLSKKKQRKVSIELRKKMKKKFITRRNYLRWTKLNENLLTPGIIVIWLRGVFGLVFKFCSLLSKKFEKFIKSSLVKKSLFFFLISNLPKIKNLLKFDSKSFYKDKFFVKKLSKSSNFCQKSFQIVKMFNICQ